MDSKKRDAESKLSVLEEIGKEGKAGDKNFKDYTKLKEIESKIKRDSLLGKLDAERKNLTYHKFLSDLLLKRIYAICDITKGWVFQVMPTDRGVVMELKSPDGRIFRSAFKSTKVPELDLNAVDTFAIRADVTMNRFYDNKIIV